MELILITKRTGAELRFTITEICAVAFDLKEDWSVFFTTKFQIDELKEATGEEIKDGMLRFISWFNAEFKEVPRIWVGNKEDWKDIQKLSRYFWGHPICSADSYEIAAVFEFLGWPKLDKKDSTFSRLSKYTDHFKTLYNSIYSPLP